MKIKTKVYILPRLYTYRVQPDNKKMVILLEKAQTDGYNPTLKIKNLLTFEYAIISKEFAEPKTGTSKYGEWNCYGITTHEYKSQDPATGNPVDFKTSTKSSFFPSAKTHLLMKDIPVGVKFKITSEQVEGAKGQFTKYNVELLDKIETAVSANNVAPGQTAERRLKTLKDAGTSKEDAVALISKEFDVSDVLLNSKFDAL